MKKVSLAGVILGVVLGVIAGLLSESWFFWLGAGLAIGVVVGSVQARRSLMHDARVKAGSEPMDARTEIS
jgi:F0F1-type ATP synthase assembly protein I